MKTESDKMREAIIKKLVELLVAEQKDSGFGSDSDHSYEAGMKDAINIVENYE